MINPDLARIRTFDVVPALPEPLTPLMTLARNLWWSWHPEAVELFIRLDRELWQASHHNPVRMLGMVAQDRLEAAARDEGFLTSLERVTQALHEHRDRTGWYHGQHSTGPASKATIAYFCAEFGLTECLQIYSGGLGCLAGDHLKSASELGLPLVGVGLLYRHGYFQQYLSPDGWQQEYTPDHDFSTLPVQRVEQDGQQVMVSLRMPGRDVHVALWKAWVGRIPLYLLDTNLPQNTPADRGITGQLYGGDMEMRIKQELILGIAGCRALKAIGIEPEVCHMNEGHAAFLALERIANLIETHGVSFDEARQAAASSHVFTTHTPVPAGIDRFPPDMIQRYFEDQVHRLKLDMEGLLALGRDNVYNRNEFFSMATLAIRTSDWANGVSKLHGQVSRAMWRGIWPEVPAPEVPIGHVTNGVHARSWMSGDLIVLADRYLGGRWQTDPADQGVWEAMADVPDEELWRLHERRRQRLIVWARRTVKQQLTQSGQSDQQVRRATEGLSDGALTIGFARRFATYKRGNLFLRDVARLERMLADADRPVQFLIAGKSHPADGGGKDLIRQIIKFSRESDVGHKVVFLENYDIHVARYLVQGCDVWLNNPRRGMEASGTSGMKAALNGVLNCSVLDGWWDEAYEPGLGWAIGRRETYADPEAGDRIESAALYDLLEKQIIPMFYDRDAAGLPRRWIQAMKKCIATLTPVYNTNRMVAQYTDQLYVPAAKRAAQLNGDGLAQAVDLAAQKVKLRGAWQDLQVLDVKTDAAGPLNVRDDLQLTARVKLGELSPDEVRVQAWAGPIDNDGRIVDGSPVPLQHREANGDGEHVFAGTLSATTSGRHGFAVRVMPGGTWFEHHLEPGLILWEGGDPPAPSTPKAAQDAAA